MRTSEPFVRIRPPNYPEGGLLCDLVCALWGRKARDRCFDQFIEYFKGGKYAPVFMVAVDAADRVIGFAAYHRTMQCTFNIIWLVVMDKHKGLGIGKHLVQACCNAVEEKDGMLIEVITQVPEFYQRVGFEPVKQLGNDWHLLLKPLGEFGL